MYISNKNIKMKLRYIKINKISREEELISANELNYAMEKFYGNESWEVLLDLKEGKVVTTNENEYLMIESLK